MKVNPQAQSLLTSNSKDLKPKAEAAQQQKSESKATTKVDELKQQVAQGSYRVDVDKTADAMLNEFIR